MSIDTILSREELLDRVGNDIDFLHELADLFAEGYPELLQKIEQAIQQKNRELLENTAHELKGVVGNFCAPRAMLAAQKMQVNGKNADFIVAETDLNSLTKTIKSVELALKKLIEEYTSQNN